MAVAPSELEQPARPSLYLVQESSSPELADEISLSSFSRVILRDPNTNRIKGTRVLGLRPDWIKVNGSGRPERGTAEDKGAFPGIIAIIGADAEIATGACIGLLHGRRFHLVPYRRGGEVVDHKPMEGAREIVVGIKELQKLGHSALGRTIQPPLK